MESKYMNAVLYAYMESAMLVYETFHNLFTDEDKLDDDILYSESDTETYANLIEMAMKIEDKNQQTGGEMCREDIIEMAEPMILEVYGKKKENVKQFSIDIEGTNDEVTEGLINAILLGHGLNVRGSAWKATWDKEDYDEGKGPVSSD